MPNNQTVPETGQAAFQIHEAGVIVTVRECIARVEGLPSVINGQIVEFEQGGRGIVMGFNEKDVQVLVISSKGPLHVGERVLSTGEFLRLPVGDGFLGRIVNALCEPVDQDGPIQSSDMYPVFAEAPGVMDRAPVRETLETGTLVLDAVIPIAKGQRQLLIGDRLTGKSTVALDAIINQKGHDVICIYCCIGKPNSSLLKVLNLFNEKNVMPYTIVVSAVASCSMGEQYIAPYTACTLGEYFMKNGKDVLLIHDDLTKHAWVYRQISLLMERAPGREAYPGDIFYTHSQLMERAGYFKPELGGGSMTFLPIVEILQGDVTGYVSSNLISMTDGQIYFSTALFNKGVRPAIDFGLSVSRIGNKAQWPAMKALSGQMRLEYIQYQELLQMTQLRTTGLSREAEDRMKRGQAITQLLVQDKNKPLSMEAEVMYLFALSMGVLDTLAPADIKKFKDNFVGLVSREFPDLFTEIRTSMILNDTSIEMLYEALNHYFAQG
ncbi:MAG TPA: F0F1 ATP synthase subunit alpha [Candidatus Omnitrophota bacterium]|nr:F0F1 ATP synthase subunit alpha [Candidatus Omnitrophota bacterium]HRZ14479.1 F0F1 ATP synthase subunit alpha [Candidatus Omnitrophota bacterium]